MLPAGFCLPEATHSVVEEHACTLVRRSDGAAERREEFAAHAEFIVGEIDGHRLPLGQISRIDEQLERALDRVQPNDVALADAGDRTAVDRFRRDVDRCFGTLPDAPDMRPSVRSATRKPRSCNTPSGGVSLCSSGMPFAFGPWKRTTAMKSRLSLPSLKASCSSCWLWKMIA